MGVRLAPVDGAECNGDAGRSAQPHLRRGECQTMDDVDGVEVLRLALGEFHAHPNLAQLGNEFRELHLLAAEHLAAVQPNENSHSLPALPAVDANLTEAAKSLGVCPHAPGTPPCRR